jgi:hypothetical protein
LLFTFSKEGSAVFHGHLGIVDIFSMAMCRAGIDALYTQGFNPLAKLEITAPLSLGISAGAEVAAADFSFAVNADEFIEKINNALPEGLTVNRAECYCIPAGCKKHSLSSLLWGFGYGSKGGETRYVSASEEKTYRAQWLHTGNSIFHLHRACVLAKNITGGESSTVWTSYFDLYRFLYNFII